MPVASATISRVHREEGNLHAAVLRGFSYMTGVVCPFLVMLALLAQPIVLVFYGRQWVDAIPVAQIFCVSAIITSSRAMGVLTLNAIGAMRHNLLIQVIILVNTTAAMIKR